MQNGDPISDGSIPIGRTLLVHLGLALMKEGTFMCIKIMLAVMLTFLAIGRSGEVSCAIWAILKWCYERGCFWLVWNERKTGDHDQLPFMADR